jgi:hypothetical protein
MASIVGFIFPLSYEESVGCGFPIPEQIPFERYYS